MDSVKQGPTPYSEINRVLLDLHGRVIDILGASFIGMYLYGSLAVNDFNPSRSDIDFVVITDDHLAGSIVDALESMHRELFQGGNRWVKKLEGAYVPKAIIRRHVSDHPPVPMLNEGKFYTASLGGDWVLQRKMLRNSNRAISGPLLYDLIDPVSPDDLKSAMLEVIDEWWEPMLDNPSRLQDPGYQPYAVLSMCRTLYTLTTGELVSKEKAASWAMESLASGFYALIDHALGWGEGDPIESIDRTTEFIKYVIELCRSL
ncbi:MAG: DUF4111 domain-containing protein [Anaerolineales bacterium]|nr:DUF4111 domain-containing protein [Anaerolineales bacterium]